MTKATDFKLRPLHRQRTRRRAQVRILDQRELAEHFGVDESKLKVTLRAAGWRYHEDAAGQLWASMPPEQARATNPPQP